MVTLIVMMRMMMVMLQWVAASGHLDLDDNDGNDDSDVALDCRVVTSTLIVMMVMMRMMTVMLHWFAASGHLDLLVAHLLGLLHQLHSGLRLANLLRNLFAVLARHLWKCLR